MVRQGTTLHPLGSQAWRNRLQIQPLHQLLYRGLSLLDISRFSELQEVVLYAGCFFAIKLRYGLRTAFQVYLHALHKVGRDEARVHFWANQAAGYHAQHHPHLVDAQVLMLEQRAHGVGSQLGRIHAVACFEVVAEAVHPRHERLLHFLQCDALGDAYGRAVDVGACYVVSNFRGQRLLDLVQDYIPQQGRCYQTVQRMVVGFSIR